MFLYKYGKKLFLFLLKIFMIDYKAKENLLMGQKHYNSHQNLDPKWASGFLLFQKDSG